MSDRLALSSAFSVLMMACYVLFGGNAVQAPLDVHTTVPSHASAPAGLPQVMAILPR